MIKYFTCALLTVLLFAGVSKAQNADSYAEKTANSVLQNVSIPGPDDIGKTTKWNYEHSLVLKAIEGVWHKTSDNKYYDYIQNYIDAFVDDNGDIRSYQKSSYNIDNVLGGRVLLSLYAVTRMPKYYKAALRLREQLREQPRLKNGGFWHKKIYPNQMWLDGLYMGEPFYAEWAATFSEDSAFNDIAAQFILMEQNSRDSNTGLLYHGYDESREQLWANKTTGTSPHFWGRSMGWYGMALVDVFDYFPESHPKRKELIAILNRFAEAVVKVQDDKTGLWWDVMNFPGREKNYLESSASAMLVYTLAKGVRTGLLPQKFLPAAKKGYSGIIERFVEDKDGRIDFTGTVSVSGLGGKPYRDGSYDYYVSEKVVTNDLKGVGAFILASNEMELLPTLPLGKGKTVVLDSYFNNEYRRDAAGIEQPYHYQWRDQSHGGFSLLGYLFNSYGVKTETLYTAPSGKKLRNADIYIIVDPDDTKEVPSPNYIGNKDIKAIKKWVKNGGVLLLFANDSSNTELKHFNELVKDFGIHWRDDSRNWVKGKAYETGAVVVPDGNEVFTPGTKLFLKEICLIDITKPATSLLTDSGDVIVATAKYGKGTVLAVGDPWLYNEYVAGRKLPREYRNDIAARDLIKWAIGKTKTK